MIFGLVHESLSRGVLIKQKKWKVTLVEKGAFRYWFQFCLGGGLRKFELPHVL